MRTLQVKALRTTLALLGLAVVALPLAARTADAQAARNTARLTGTVTNQATGVPVPNATVSLAGTSYATQAGADGRYTLSGLPAGIYAIEARRIGYGPAREANVRLVADSTRTLNFQLNDQPLQLEAITVSATVDPTSGRKTPYTVANVSAADMPVPTSSSAASAIQGKVAGARILRARGPGAGVYVQLRTPTSQFKTTTPLYVVDGVILSSETDVTTSDIESMDIANIEVIKGAAAATMYGSRGANGVISITTNRGNNLELGSTQFNVRGEYGFNRFAGFLPRSDRHHFLVNEAGQYVDTDGNVVDRDDRVSQARTQFQQNAYIDPLYNQAKDFFDPGSFYSARASLAQNSASTNWLAAYNRFSDGGVVPNNTGYWRQNVRVNLDHRIRDDFRFGVSAYYNRAQEDDPRTSFFDFFQTPPDVDLSVRNADGSIPALADTTFGLNHPLYAETIEDYNTRRARTQLSGSSRWQPLGWLSFDGNISYDRSNVVYDNFRPRGVLEVDGEDISDGRYEIQEENAEAVNANIGATFLRQFNDLTGRLTVQALMNREDAFVNEAIGTDFGLAGRGVRDLDVARQESIASTAVFYRENSYLATLGMDWAGKLIGDFTFRRDGNSLFGPDNRWNNFYRASAAYLVNEEAWWPFESLNLFKLRYSLGQGGTRPDFSDQYETLSLTTGGGITRQNKGNPLLKPEIATEQEFGIETIINNRFSVQLVYAMLESDNNIIGIEQPAISGFNSQEANVGRTTGNTIEASIQAQWLRRGSLSWESNIVLDRSRNRVEEFNRSCYTEIGDATSYLRCEGNRLGIGYGERFLRSAAELPEVHASSQGQFQVNDDGYLVAVGSLGNWWEGGSKNLWGKQVVIDGVNYDWGHVIAEVDSMGQRAFVPIADYNADLNFGFGNTVRWGNLQLYGLFTGQLGGDIYNRAKQLVYEVQFHPDLNQAGKADSLKKPVAYYESGVGLSRGYTSRFTSHFVEDGTYAKLSELSARYTLRPERLGALRRLGADQVTLELIGRNIFTLTGYDGIDPEAGTPQSRVDTATYPATRNFTFAVNLLF